MDVENICLWNKTTYKYSTWKNYALPAFFLFQFPSNKSEICCIIRATPGNRQVKSKGVVVKKKKYSPPKDIPQGTIVWMQSLLFGWYKTFFHGKFLMRTGSLLINCILRALVQSENGEIIKSLIRCQNLTRKNF